MDVVLVGLPGSGKSAVGRRLAGRFGAVFLDLDAGIEQATGLTIPEIFERDGEAAFRAMERAAIDALGPPDRASAVRRVVSTGGGAVVDPRNRWRLYRGRLPIWLDARPEVLAQRLRRSRNVRPLVANSADPIATVRSLAGQRERFYGAAARVNGVAEVGSVLDAVRRVVAAGRPLGTTLLRTDTGRGTLTIGEGIVAPAVAAALDRLDARRAVVVTEPGAWAAVGQHLVAELRDAGRTIETVLLPQGEAAKRLSVIEDAARELAQLRLERTEPIVAVGGGALGDAAGFLAATWLRGVPLIHVPTTLVAQIDSSIGGKTAVDLPEGKNLVGAFHQPVTIIVDVGLLATLPEHQRRAALGEAVKMAALGDERLFTLLESDGEAIAAGDVSATQSGALAELVERAAWAKVEVVAADEREHGGSGAAEVGRLALNLGHTAGHAVEAAGGFRELLHGEAVAYGLRVACRLGVAAGVTPPERADRIERLLDRLGLAVQPLPYPIDAVRAAMTSDKKRADGRQRWVLPTANGVVVRNDIPDEQVAEALGSILRAPSGAPMVDVTPAAPEAGR